MEKAVREDGHESMTELCLLVSVAVYQTDMSHWLNCDCLVTNGHESLTDL